MPYLPFTIYLPYDISNFAPQITSESFLFIKMMQVKSKSSHHTISGKH